MCCSYASRIAWMYEVRAGATVRFHFHSENRARRKRNAISHFLFIRFFFSFPFWPLIVALGRCSCSYADLPKFVPTINTFTWDHMECLHTECVHSIRYSFFGELCRAICAGATPKTLNSRVRRRRCRVD